jgi:hypothetical protein
MSFKKFSTGQDAAKQDRSTEMPAAVATKTAAETKPTSKS